MVSVLSVVEDPLDAVALAGALRSPFFSLSDEALFWPARKFEGGLSEGLPRAVRSRNFPTANGRWPCGPETC